MAVIKRIPGHHRICNYARSGGHFKQPCTCQPPTLWGLTMEWKCDCCGLARAANYLNVCQDCLGHEYADPRAVTVAHASIE
jgi:hypothetical protein